MRGFFSQGPWVFGLGLLGGFWRSARKLARLLAAVHALPLMVHSLQVRRGLGGLFSSFSYLVCIRSLRIHALGRGVVGIVGAILGVFDVPLRALAVCIFLLRCWLE